MLSESFRTISCSVPGLTMNVSIAEPGTVVISVPSPESFSEHHIQVTIAKPFRIETLNNTGPPLVPEDEPSHEDIQAQYGAIGVRVRDYAYAGQVISPVVPKNAVSANSMKAYLAAKTALDSITNKPVVQPTPPVPEIFDPSPAMAIYLKIMIERQKERNRENLGELSRYDSFSVKASDVAIPGKILHRLWKVASWLSEEDTKDWLPIDWTSLKNYGDSGAAAIQPVRVRRMPEPNLQPWEQICAKGDEEGVPPTTHYNVGREVLDHAGRSPPPTRAGNGVHVRGGARSALEAVKTIARVNLNSSCPKLGSVYKGGQYAEGIKGTIPTQHDRWAIYEAHKGTALLMWNCLKRDWAERQGLRVSESKREPLAVKISEHKPTPLLKRALEDEWDGGRAEKKRLRV